MAKSVTAQGSLARAPLDTRIVIVGDWEELADRLEGALAVMREIAKIAGRTGNWPARSGTRLCSGFVVFQGVARRKTPT